jgi:hypothetical protein
VTRHFEVDGGTLTISGAKVQLTNGAVTGGAGTAGVAGVGAEARAVTAVSVGTDGKG